MGSNEEEDTREEQGFHLSKKKKCINCINISKNYLKEGLFHARISNRGI